MRSKFNSSQRPQSSAGKAVIGALALAASGVTSSALADVTINFNGDTDSFSSAFNSASFEGPWAYSATGGVGGTGGWSTIGQASDVSHTCTTDLTSSAFSVLNTGSVSLSFDHRYSFEMDATARWDGGAVFISRNGGDYTMVDNSSYSANGYSGVVTGWGYGSDLAGASPVFSGTSDGYATGTFLTSVANLGAFNAGDTISVRFRASFDSNTSAGSPSWAVDNIAIGNVIPGPSALAMVAFGTIIGRRRRRE